MINNVIKDLLQDEVQAFLRLHEQDDVQQFMLRAKPVCGVSPSMLAQQIHGRQKAMHKLPTWAQGKTIFPSTLNLEQCSSELTARYKSGLIRSVTRKDAHGVDLTGGFGVDTWFLSEVGALEYIEPDEQLLAIARHNHHVLGDRKITYHATSAEAFLKNHALLDFIYLDPSRRVVGQKKFLLEDCVPDIIRLQESLLQMAPIMLLKTSPLLDLSRGCEQLQHVAGAWVVSVDNECRELLFLLKRGFKGEPTITCTDLFSRSPLIKEYRFTFSEERGAVASFSEPLEYLYEPSAALLKGGAFKHIAEGLGISKLAPNSHLYTSPRRIEFPGRVFKVLESVKLDKSLVTKFPRGQANIITRNYPLRPEEIKKKTGLADGGDLYLICTQGIDQKFILIAERI
ncbi:MAG TPA: SAM-dependent methyltransferase [Cyclobacteriaceae bacterium]|nr:SAM-dependent methyltransferase [Cyclobacteriaceae bacterium]